MVTNKTAKEYGAETQELVAQWYRRLWPAATSTGSGAPGRDVLNVPVDIEAKGTTRFDPLAWCRQQRGRDRKPDDVLPGHTVLRPRGLGPAHVGDWMVLRCLEDDTAILEELLRLRRQVSALSGQVFGLAGLAERTEFLLPPEGELREARQRMLERHQESLLPGGADEGKMEP